MCVNCSFSCFVFTITTAASPIVFGTATWAYLTKVIYLCMTRIAFFFLFLSLFFSSFLPNRHFLQNNPIRLQAQVGQTTAAPPSPPFVRRHNANPPIAVLLE